MACNAARRIENRSRNSLLEITARETRPAGAGGPRLPGGDLQQRVAGSVLDPPGGVARHPRVPPAALSGEPLLRSRSRHLERATTGGPTGRRRTAAAADV